MWRLTKTEFNIVGDPRDIREKEEQHGAMTTKDPSRQRRTSFNANLIGLNYGMDVEQNTNNQKPNARKQTLGNRWPKPPAHKKRKSGWGCEVKRPGIILPVHLRAMQVCLKAMGWQHGHLG